MKARERRQVSPYGDDFDAIFQNIREEGIPV